MSNKLLMKGNEAIAEAAIRSGCKLFFGYPITPQTELSEYLAKNMPKIGGLSLQAESEVAAINMVLGAAAAGARVITSSSSPGISLKGEGISYIVGSDLPCVIVNIQRGGPGLGGIQPAQSDYNQATKALGHGDMHIIVLAPASVQEMATLTGEAFDLADIYRMPVMILADGALGQMMEPVDFEAKAVRELPEKGWACTGHDGKRKQNVVNSLYIDPAVLEKTVVDRFKKYEEVEQNEVKYEEYLTDDAEIIVVSYGITARIAKTAVKNARANGMKVGLFRPITLYPFPSKQLDALADKVDVKTFLSVEMNMGQMVNDIKVAINCKKNVYHFGRTGGVIPTPDEILTNIEKYIGGVK
ncbi:MAG: 3-methyl-2-oxobutanoate dehydrogenase subunit VorB [Clostridiales bacterium GWF2_36_10]|nr:MAG: 3-methyl-2-oxobutanoate dehydrogenase subunit VorB [Clostridiales bacterium GWF2_36_10]HAN20214.1 3-methyl-2-oxobutanoate dehydrogenase subunit beta [Clostridiales bacterium]